MRAGLAGVAVPEIIEAGTAGPAKDALVVYRLPAGTALSEAGTADISDVMLDDLYRQLLTRTARSAGAALLVDPTAETIVVADFRNATASASPDQLDRDLAGAIAATAVAVGAERAADAAARSLTPQMLEGALRHLHRPALDPLLARSLVAPAADGSAAVRPRPRPGRGDRRCRSVEPAGRRHHGGLRHQGADRPASVLRHHGALSSADIIMIIGTLDRHSGCSWCRAVRPGVHRPRAITHSAGSSDWLGPPDRRGAGRPAAGLVLAVPRLRRLAADQALRVVRDICVAFKQVASSPREPVLPDTTRGPDCPSPGRRETLT